MFWGGLRGSLCMAMVLSLPSSFPLREALIVTTFGVVLFTLLVQGLTIEPLMRLLKVRGSGGVESKHAALREDLKQNQNKIQRLKDDLRANKLLKKEYLAKKAELEEKEREIRKHIETLEQGNEGIVIVEHKQIQKALLEAQKDCLNKLSRDKKMDDTALETFRIKIDEELDALPARRVDEVPIVPQLRSVETDD